MNANALLPLKSVRFPIVVPRDQAGLIFQTAEPFTEEGGYEGYCIVWSTGSGRLTLNGATGGVGDPPPGEDTVLFHNPTFGQCTLEVEDNRMLTGWMSEMESGLPAYSLSGTGISRERFLQIAQSLDYIKI